MSTQANVVLRFFTSGQNSVSGVMDKLSLKKKELTKPATIPIDAEDNATITIDKVRAEADELNRKRAEITVDANDKAAQAKLLVIDMRLEKLNKYLARPEVELRGLDQTMLGILRISAALDKVNGKKSVATIEVKTRTSGGSKNVISRLLESGGGSGGGGAFSGPFAGIAGVGSGASAGVIEALTSPVGAGSAAIALPFVGTGLAGGALGALGSGLAGLGIAGGMGAGTSKPADIAAAQNTLHAAQQRVIADQAKLNSLRNSGKATTAQLAAATGALASANASVVSAQDKLGGLGAPASKQQQAAQKAFRTLSTNAKKSLSTIGASFAPVMSTIFKVADSTLGKLTPVFAGAEKTISGPFQQIGVILAQSLASPSVVTAVKGLASSFGEFLKGFAPQIPGIVNAIANGVEGMASAFTDHPGLIKGMGSVLAFLFKIPGFVAGALGSLTRVTAWLIGGFPHAVSIGLDAARNFFINIGHDIEAAWNTVWDDIKGITSTGAGAMSSIWTTITGPFRAGYNFVVGIFNGIKNYITTNFDKWWAANGASVIQLWNETWSRIKGIIDTILPPVINAVKVGLGIIIGVFTIAANAIVAAWNILWATLIGAAKIVWAEVQAVVKVGWAIISATFKTAIDIVVSIWRIFWAVISNVAKLSFTLIKNTLKLTWDIIVGIFTIFIDVITGHWSAALNAMKNLGIQVWNILKSNLSAIWNAIKAIGIAIFNALRAFFAGMWNNTKNTALASWNAVKNGLVNIWHAAVNAGKSIWNSFFGWLRSGWHAVVSSAGTIWNGIKTAIRTPVAWVVNNVWDPFANIINTATSFLHLGKPLPVKHMAGGGRLPGYGGGDKYPALLEAGETVVDKKKSRMYAGLFAAMGVPGYAAGGVAGGRPPVNLHTGVSNSGPTGGPGLGDVLNVGKTVVGFGAKLIQGAVLGVVKPAVNGILGLLSHMPGGDTGFGKMVAGLPKAVANKFFDFIGGKDKAFTATMIKNVGSGVARWAGLVNKALQMLGLPLSLASRVLYQMQTESGGNPNAINNTDINAQRGDPSRGLLQTIGSTFRAYHVAGTSNNIYDPLANIAAAINYARHVYGPTLMSGGMGMGSGHGYYIGTSNATRGWHMVGERGPEAMWFGGGEKVVPAGRVRGGDGASAPIILNVNFRGQALVSKAEIGRTVKAAIAYAERHGD